MSTTDSNVYYATYGSDTVFRSIDGAKVTSLQVVRIPETQTADIAVDPTDGNRFYVAALEGGVRRSDDGGQTLNQIFSAPPTFRSGRWGAGGANGQTILRSQQRRVSHEHRPGHDVGRPAQPAQHRHDDLHARGSAGR